MDLRHTLTRTAVGLGALMLAGVAGVAPAAAAADGRDAGRLAASSASGASRGAAVALASRTYTWGTLHSGDCQQDNGTLIIRSDGTADFSAITLTYQTHTHDVWWSTFRFYSPSGTLLVTSPTLRSPDMSDGNPPPHYSMTGHFTFDPVFFSGISSVFQSSSC